MKSLVSLVADLLTDVGRRSGVRTTRDVKTLQSRVKHEGDSFITITLPTLANDLHRSLELGRVSPGSFKAFSLERSGFPSFMKGFLSRVFAPDGSLLSNPSSDCILALRQICLFGKKISAPCTLQRTEDALEEYRKCDDDVAEVTETRRVYNVWARAVSRILLGDLDLTDDLLLGVGQSCMHGPGATQEHISGNRKWVFRRWHARLHSAGITYWQYGRGSRSELNSNDMQCWPDVVGPGAERPVRIVTVPKTFRSPRVIGVEPVCMQFAQQLISQALKVLIQISPFTRGHVNFDDQRVNQWCAFQGSKGANFATLDMKEASDRVGNSLVEWLFEDTPRLKELLQASRSKRAKLPNGDIIALKKFASMGSATCFVVEAYTFYSLVIASRLLRRGIFPNAQSVMKYSRDVYIYGDDIIVPADEAPSICDDLEQRYSLLVNRQKSFWIGKFRESCGEDYYDGNRVTPVYLRELCPANRTDASGILSWVSLYHQLSEAGLSTSAAAVREAVEEALGERLPLVPHGSPAIGWHDYSEFVPPSRFNRKLQRGEIYALVPVSPKRRDTLTGDPALAKCLRVVRGSFDPRFRISGGDPRHLDKSVTPHAVALEHGWVSRH